MKKIILLYAFLIFQLNAMLTNDILMDKNIKILKDLDLPSNYLNNNEFKIYYKHIYNKYKHTYAKKIKNASLFIPTIKNVLKQNDMPSSFIYMAMAESNFEIEAKSSKRAVGIWQFMPKTAKLHGLRVDKYIDERMDLEKSTIAAIVYLKRLHRMFDKWYLASIAYNCGEARVIEGITRVILDKYCDDVGTCENDNTIKKYRKTIRDYQAKKVKFNNLYKIYKKVKKWKYFANIDDLLIIQKNSKNKELSRQYLPKESRIYIRKIISLWLMNNKEYLFDENDNIMNNYEKPKLKRVQIEGGILIKNVANIIDISKKQLKFLNPHIKRNITPFDDNKYGIYIPASKINKFNNNIAKIKTNVFEEYIVKKGDNLGKISNIFDVNYKIIKKYNNLKNNTLRIGQTLIVPIDPDTYKRPKYYKVKKGDTLYHIARKFNVPLKRILDDNPKRVAMLSIGDDIVINFK